MSGKDSYPQFYEHTLQVHGRTPLTNHTGLRVLVAHNVGSGKTATSASGATVDSGIEEGDEE